MSATRVDSAHPHLQQPGASVRAAHPAVADAQGTLEDLDPSPEVLAVLAGLIPEAAAEQLQKQATQLAAWLREREVDLEHREGQIQSQAAELDKRMRQARLWIQDRELELHARDVEQRAIAAELSKRAAEVEAGQSSAEQGLQSLRAALVLREEEVKRHREELSACEAELRRRGDEQRRRERDLEETGVALLRQAEALQAAERAWAAERAAQENQLAAQRDELAPARSAGGSPAQAPVVSGVSPDERELLYEQLARERANLVREFQQERELLFEQLARERRLWERDREELLARQSEPVAMEPPAVAPALAPESNQNLAREAELLRAEAELAAERQAVIDERRELLQRLAVERDELAEERANTQAEWAERREELARRTEALESRRAAVEQLHADVAELHREALEMRLMTEELWGQVSARISPAQLTQSVAHLRTRLADHYRLAEQSLAAKRDELRELTARLDEHHARLREQRRSVQDWVSARTSEIEEQAARLVAREQQLAAQAEHYAAAKRSWEQERRRLHAQLNQLQQLSVA